MVERMGICEKHQLPLDRNGECELCRLSDMPSNPPPAGSAWWAVIIPIVLAIAGIAWAAWSWSEPEPQSEPQRGVRTTAPRPATPAPSVEQPPEPEVTPAPPTPPVPGGDTPSPEPSLEPSPEPSPEPSLEPSPESGQLEETGPARAATSETEVPAWKWGLARRRVHITMYATQWCGVCRKAREYMETNQIDFIELDAEQSPAAGERLGELNPGRTVPTFEIDEQVYIGFREELLEARIDEAARKYL